MGPYFSSVGFKLAVNELLWLNERTGVGGVLGAESKQLAKITVTTI